MIGQRGRMILRTGAWSLLAKALTTANLLVSVPYVLDCLGPHEFGAWATLVSFAVMAGFLDFGLGNGTMNLVASAHGKADSALVGNVVRVGYGILLKISGVLAIIAALAIILVPWHAALGMPATSEHESRTAAAIVTICIVLSPLLNLAARIQLGLGQGEKSFFWQAIGQLLVLLLVIPLSRRGASLSLLTAAAVATPLLTSAANSLLLLRATLWREKNLGISTTSTENQSQLAATIGREGVLFFVLQLAAALSFSADLAIIAALRGSDEAGRYAMLQRLFSIIPLCLTLVWIPLWPIYRQALAAGDMRWARQTLRRSTCFALLFSVSMATALTLGLDRLLQIWIRQPLQIDHFMVLGFGSWCVIEAIATSIATFFNAASVVRYQVVIACIFAPVCVAGKIWAAANGNISWMPWIAVLVYAVICLLPLAFCWRRILNGIVARAY